MDTVTFDLKCPNPHCNYEYEIRVFKISEYERCPLCGHCDLLIKFKATHKVTKETISISAEDKESAYQLCCSENTFLPSLKEQVGWWDRKDVEITET